MIMPNGFPLPPPPDTQPTDSQAIVFLAILFSIAAVFTVMCYLARWLELRHQDEQQIMREAIKHEKDVERDVERQYLISAAPGGRKPWQ